MNQKYSGRPETGEELLAMNIIEVIGHVDEQHQLHAELPADVRRRGPGVRGCAVAASVAVLDHRSPAGWDPTSQWRIDVRRRRSRRWSPSPVPDPG